MVGLYTSPWPTKEWYISSDTHESFHKIRCLSKKRFQILQRIQVLNLFSIHPDVDVSIHPEFVFKCFFLISGMSLKKIMEV